MRALLFLSLAALTGCGPAVEEVVTYETTAGAEAAPAARPTGPAPSYLAAGTKVLARIDVARIRRSPLALDISSAIRASPTWQSLGGSAGGADPVQDFDSILVGGDQLYTERRVAVLRHPHTEAEVRQRVLRIAIDRGQVAEWRTVDGFAVVSWPVPRSVPYSLVITAEHELVLAPDDELPRIVEVARDHAARRTRPDEVIEPSLAMRGSEIATVVMDVPPPRREGYPDPPERLRVEIDEEAAGSRLAIHSEFATDAQATAAHAWLDAQARYWSQQLIVRMSGMNRPIEEARFEREGTRLDVGTTLTVDELRRLLGLMALSQLAQRG
jgi:hypothetical protein